MTELPYSVMWLLFLMLADFILLLQSLSSGKLEQNTLLLVSLSSFFLVNLALYLLLKFRKMTVRYVKTAMGYFGTEIVLNLMFVMFLVVTQAIAALPLLLLTFFAWNFALKGFILRHSLNMQAQVAILLAICIEVLRGIPFMIVFMDTLTQQQAGMM